MRSDQVHIDSPCHESWDAMTGDSERRFCGVCEKHVHNLSAMRHDDAQALLGAAPGENLCVRYAVEDDGSLRFRDLVPRSRLTRGLRRAAFAAVMLAACSPQGNEPIAELADVAVSSIREAAVPTPDGGCNVTTGPFTTFHFPPGHALCGPATAEATVVAPVVAPEPMVPQPFPAVQPVQVQPVMPVQPMVPVMPLPDPFPAAGEPEPYVPEPIVAPVRPPMRMGRAIRTPEKVDPFEPCDPPTNGFAPPPPPNGFAPPPPTRRIEPREPPRRELMGDIAVPVERPMVQGGLRRADPPATEPGFAPPPR
jgi:hypothetical protein